MPDTPRSPEPRAPDRRTGFLLGPLIGSALAASTATATTAAAIRERLDPGGQPVAVAPPPGRRRAGTALADGLLEELLEGGVDLHRLAHRWVEWWQRDGLDADPLLAAALDHLRDFDAPVERLLAPGCAPIAAALPAALASASPRAMISGAFHVARLLDPAEEAGLAAVGVVVAAAALLEGRRDVVGDVLAMFRANGAPEPLVETIRDVPRRPRVPPSVPRSGTSPGAALAWLLWNVEYRPRAVEALADMTRAGGVDHQLGAALGALLGARDGVDDWPEAWLAGAGEDLVLRRAVARRLGPG